MKKNEPNLPAAGREKSKQNNATAHNPNTPSLFCRAITPELENLIRW